MIPLIQVESVSKHYKAASDAGGTTVLQDVSFHLEEGQSLCLVGESGAGKSTLARLLLGLEVPDSGRILFQGKVMGGKNHRRELKRFIQIIWQDPVVYLNPYYTVSELITEPMAIFGMGNGSHQRDKMMQLLGAVGLSVNLSARRPCELSGGQCQRVAIARALAVNPRVLICDEALAGLDIPQQARILRLLIHLQQSMNLTCLFITHDLSAVSRICPKMAILTAGKIIEIGDTRQLLHHPVHPYSRQLMQRGDAPSDDGRLS
ncbi:MAG: ABC transporter ATP-binding protein [Deltaproteobacteria bacterium]|nr:ABC transporter ATP-binding protein [Deltaproteobacteria bacterium]